MLNVPQSANINDLALGRGPIIGSERRRTAIIIGAGVVGMATAYALAQRDIRVTVIEGQESPGLGASFANGAQLSYAYTDALASPAFLSKRQRLFSGLIRPYWSGRRSIPAI
jgi:glycine/D-amino acid oxidase-like deaminating enzyme